jgi:hypothetical protein
VKRRTFNLLAGLSLLLFAATLLLGSRSYDRYDCFQIGYCDASAHQETGYVWSALSAHGGWKLQVQSDMYAKGSYRVPLPHQSGLAQSYRLYPFFGTWHYGQMQNPLQAAGFDFSNSYSGNPPEIIRGIITPFWFLYVVFLILPILWLWHRPVSVRRRGFPVE